MKDLRGAKITTARRRKDDMAQKVLKQTIIFWAVVVAQLVERSLPTPEVRGSNPVMCELLFI